MTAADDGCGVRSPTVCRQRGEWLAPFRAVASPGFGARTKRHGNGETDRQTERGKWLAPFRAVASPGFGWGQNDMEMERQTDRQTERGKWLAPFRAVASPGFGRGQNDMEMERQTERGKWLAPFRAVASPGFGARTEEGHKTTWKYSSHAHKIHRAKKTIIFHFITNFNNCGTQNPEDV